MNKQQGLRGRSKGSNEEGSRERANGGYKKVSKESRKEGKEKRCGKGAWNTEKGLKKQPESQGEEALKKRIEKGEDVIACI